MNAVNQTILVTGATGFLGSHLVKDLLASGKYKIIILKRSFSDCERIKGQISDCTAYDIDQQNIETVFSENRVDHIIHTAVEYGRDSMSCYKTLETNLMFPIALIEQAIKHNVTSFINTDSFFNKDNMGYSTLLNYSLSKKSLKTWLKAFSHQVKVVNVVLEHIYGPADSSTKFVERMFQDIAINKNPEINLTFGHQKRDFTYISDVTRAYLCLLDMTSNNDFRFREYSVGTGEAISLQKFVAEIKAVSKSASVLNFGAVAYREDEIMYSCGDPIELTNLGWSAEVDFKTGLANILKIYSHGPEF